MRGRLTRLWRRFSAQGRSAIGSFGHGPVFIFSVHRSGGTLLMRLLNCHEKLVIWGEHGGILNRLAEISEIVELHKSLNPLDDDGRELKRFVRNQGAAAQAFSPWAGPLNQPGFRRAARRFVAAIFSRGLLPGQRWGFKEIRYYRPQLAAFLLTLFPNAQLILLQRELVPAAVSNILAPWSLDFIKQRNPELNHTAATGVIEDVAYGLIAFHHAFDEIAGKFPRRVLRLNYEMLRDDGEAAISQVARFLRLDVTPEVTAAWRRTLAATLGGTDKLASGGILNRAMIEDHLATTLPRLQQQFAAEGTRPLLARSSPRQRPYAAILGDHTVNEGDHATIF